MYGWAENILVVIKGKEERRDEDGVGEVVGWSIGSGTAYCMYSRQQESNSLQVLRTV